jgi:fengycin family lipopeptide synthetase B
MTNIAGKKIVLTGGSEGIGRALGESLLKSGAQVVICSRNAKDIKKTCKELDPSGKLCFGMACDVSNEKKCKALVKFALKKMGTIDVLINNAGIIGEVGPIEESNMKKWQSTFEVNVLGVAQMSKYVLPIMKKKKFGKIINFAGGGVGGKKPMPRFGAYFSSKMAVVGLTETLASEVSLNGIKVNCVAPGAINTAITEETLARGISKIGEAAYNQIIEQKKKGGDALGSVIELVRFLCSDDSDHISGCLLSAKWDTIEKLKSDVGENIYKLRRIDNELFQEKSYGK